MLWLCAQWHSKDSLFQQVPLWNKRMLCSWATLCSYPSRPGFAKMTSISMNRWRTATARLWLGACLPSATLSFKWASWKFAIDYKLPRTQKYKCSRYRYSIQVYIEIQGKCLLIKLLSNVLFIVFSFFWHISSTFYMYSTIITIMHVIHTQ